MLYLANRAPLEYVTETLQKVDANWFLAKPHRGETSKQ